MPEIEQGTMKKPGTVPNRISGSLVLDKKDKNTMTLQVIFDIITK